VTSHTQAGSFAASGAAQRWRYKAMPEKYKRIEDRMYEFFFEEMNKLVPLTADEQEMITPYLKSKKVRKKQYILQEGDPCTAVAFIVKGLLRQYLVDDNGNENIIQFAAEGWFIADLYSYFTGEPSAYNIDAVEDGVLIMIDKKSSDLLMDKVPAYERCTRLQITRAYIALQKRLSSMISSSTEERYLDFRRQYPQFVQRVPQHMIASYMGLTPETLSRARKRIITKR